MLPCKELSVYSFAYFVIANLEVGQTGALRDHQGRPETERRRIPYGHPQSLLSFRKSHQSGLLLPARLLCRHPLRAWEMLSLQVLQCSSSYAEGDVRLESIAVGTVEYSTSRVSDEFIGFPISGHRANSLCSLAQSMFYL